MNNFNNNHNNTNNPNISRKDNKTMKNFNNLRNFGIIEGRLAREISVFDNADGSKKILLNVAVRDSFPDRNGVYNTQFVNLEAYVCADTAAHGLGPYAYIHKGDPVCFEYSIRSFNYERDGQIIYGQNLHIEQVMFKEMRNAVAKATAKSLFTKTDNVPFSEPAGADSETVGVGYDRKEW